MLCCAVLSCVVLCLATLCYAMLCYAMLCYAMLCYAMLCYAMLCYAMLCCAMLCYAMLCYAMLCYAMLCFAMLCYAMLCFAMLCYAMLCYAMLCCAVSNNLTHFVGPFLAAIEHTVELCPLHFQASVNIFYSFLSIDFKDNFSSEIVSLRFTANCFKGCRWESKLLPIGSTHLCKFYHKTLKSCTYGCLNIR